MISRACTIICLTLIISISHASNNIVGWHWYNLPDKRTKNPLLKKFNQMSANEQLKILQKVTNNLKDKAILSGRVKDIAAYKAAQDFWVHKASMFTVGWEQMLVSNPSLDYSLSHPTANSITPIYQHNKHYRENLAILKLSQEYGLLLFYRNHSLVGKKFSNNMEYFSRIHHMPMISVDVDNPSNLYKAHNMGIFYYPSLILINPNTDQKKVVSYGFRSNNQIADRLLKISDNWIPEF